MFVFKNKKLKILFISVILFLIEIYEIYGDDLRIEAINYKLLSSNLTCQILLKNINENTLYIISPEDAFFSISKKDNQLIIKTFSPKELNGGVIINENKIIQDKTNAEYDYSFYSEVQSKESLVLFFDLDFTKFLMANTEIKSLYDYNDITIQFIYSNSLINDNPQIFIQDFTICTAIKEKKDFNIFDYKSYWDNSMLFIGKEE